MTLPQNQQDRRSKRWWGVNEGNEGASSYSPLGWWSFEDIYEAREGEVLSHELE